ncbi:chitinase N-terminal domain-containing protein [Paucibacter sp. APW11]|uniref:Chitinase N-terminal domain-containing protein n=1 Tax=Roseateles aquae TaxID=3077235 RepID=A0ABU3PHC6_9BURK|nr:carbohydrate-binding protein [Paucibacter sp. APW11]MDT9001956.1 chitinase N-terminal domain-containing protein [Paucibacter sp. APW11]
MRRSLMAPLLLAACAVSAAPLTIVSSGIIESGHDALGLFGPANGDLAGKRFVQSLELESSVLQPGAEQPGLLVERGKPGQAAIRGELRIEGRSYAWQLRDSALELRLASSLSQAIGESRVDQLAIALSATSTQSADGRTLSWQSGIQSALTPFNADTQLLRPRSPQAWAAGTDAAARFSVATAAGGRSEFSARLASLQWQATPPAIAQIQYIDAVGKLAGDSVNISWVKWWGAPGDHWQLLHQGSTVCEGQQALPVGQPGEQQQHGSCTAALAAGENRFVLRLCSGDVCSESPPYRLIVEQPSVQGSSAAWRPEQVYFKGQQVQHQAQIYQARYWTQGEAPGDDSAAWQAVASLKFVHSQLSTSRWRHGADAAYSIMFDDYCGWANDAGQQLGEQELSQRQLVAAFGVMPGACGDPAWSYHWPRLQQFVARGHEVFNHSWDHGHPLNEPWAAKPWGGDDLEILASTRKVAEQLQGYQMQFFGFPFDAASDSQLAYLKARPQYLGTRMPNYWQANGINDGNFSDPFRLRFQVYANADQADGNPASLSQLLADTLAQQGWGIRVFHSVADGYYESVPLASYQAHLDQLQRAVQQGRLWVGTVSEVLKYRFAREHCALRPPQPVARGLLISFDNQSDDCVKYATPLTLQLLRADGPVQVFQGGQAIPVKQASDGSLLITVHPRQGSVLLN